MVATTIAFLAFGKGWLADLSNPLWLGLTLVLGALRHHDQTYNL